MGNVLLSWKAPVHAEHERSRRWFMYAGAFVALCIVFALFTKAWSFAVVMIAAAGLYAAMHRKNVAAPDAEIVIFENGVLFGGTYTRWELCKDFWLLALPEWRELHIVRKTGSPREIVIQTTAQIPFPQIRATLSQFLTERVDQKERVLDRCIRFFKL